MSMSERLLASRYVDTHFHLDLYNDPQSCAQQIGNSDVGAIAVTNAPFVFDACATLVRDSPQIVPAIGLHPELAVRCADQLGMFRDKVGTTRFVGEVGLDYVTRNTGERSKQRQVFEYILECCADREDIFMTVHSRRAAADVISMVGSEFSGTTVLHWFSGSVTDLERAQEAGMFFSVNTAMVSSGRGRQLIDRMRRDRVLTETDGPFVQVKGRQALPQDVTGVVHALARLWGTSEETARVTVKENLAAALGVEQTDK